MSEEKTWFEALLIVGGMLCFAILLVWKGWK